MNRFLIIVAFFLSAQIVCAQPAARVVSAKVDEYMKAAMKHDQFSGSILVARRGMPVISKGYGMASYELSVPNTPDTAFRIASLTKQFTAMAVMQLQERGKLKVDDPLCKYIDKCPPSWSPITIRHLLTHTSGIPNYSSLPRLDEEISVRQYTRAEFVGVFRDLPLQFTPGENYRYSNSAYYLLGLIIERVSGKNYGDFIRENIFVPLGMTSSGYGDLHSVIRNRADGYDWGLNSFVRPKWELLHDTFSSGALYSTTGDLLRWDAALYTEKLVSQKSLDEIFTAVKNNYGYGWEIEKRLDRPATSHSGSLLGFSSYILRFPDDRVTVIVLSNSDRTSATKVGNNLAAITFGNPYKLPEPQIIDMLAETIESKGVAEAVALYRELKSARADKYDFSEDLLNELGYTLLGHNRVKDAIEIFKLNVEMFPKAANPYDSLGEAYMTNGEKEQAIRNYVKSLELDPKNGNAVDKLKELRGGN